MDFFLAYLAMIGVVIFGFIKLLFTLIENSSGQTGNLLTTIENLQKLLGFFHNRRQHDNARLRQKLLQAVKVEVTKRLEDTLHNRVMINLLTEDQRQQVGRISKSELVPEVDQQSGTLVAKMGKQLERLLRIRNRPEITLEPTQKLINVFEQPDIAGQLLILGEPGSGKTTGLLELAEDLSKRAEKDITAPIPVIFELASWNNDKQPIEKWLISQLRENYNIPATVSSQWLQNQQLLPLLDGLDELGLVRQVKCVTAINQFVAQRIQQQLVICCRREEYEDGGIKLNQLNGAIYLLPLNNAQIRQYLSDVGRQSLWENIQHEPELRDLAKSPLLLTIMVVTYQEKTIKSLQELFDAYIDQKFEYSNLSRAYPSGKEPSRHQSRLWLSWLAKKMQEKSQTELLIESIQPSWLPTEIQKRLYRAIVGFIAGFIVVLTVNLGVKLTEGIVAGLNEHLVFNFIGSLFFGIYQGFVLGAIVGIACAMIGFFLRGWIDGLILSLIVGLICGFISSSILEFQDISSGITDGIIFGLFAGIVTKISLGIRKVETLKWSWSRARRGLLYGFIGGGIAGLIVGSIEGLTSGDYIDLVKLQFWMRLPVYILIRILLLGIIFGIPLALVTGLTGPEIRRRTIPNQGIWQSLGNAGIFSVLGGVILGTIFGAINLHQSSMMLLYYILTGCLIGGIIAGLIPGLATIQHFSLRLMLYFLGYMPWNYARFLNYATEHQFLQRIGGRYRFIHGLLREHFAQMPLK